MTGRRLSSRAQLEGRIVSNKPFAPQPIVHGRERDQAVDTMSRRIVQTYLASSESDRRQGERFYSREAHGSARAIAAGIDPDSPHGRLLRSMPSPGEWRTEVPQGPAEPVPQTPERKAFEEHVHRTAGGLARLSPQTDWDRNIRQAHEVARLSDEDVARLRQNDRSVLQGKELWRQTNANILAAHAVMHGHQAPEQNIATAPNKRVKIGSFYQNIVAPDESQATTVDFRQHDISAGRLLDTGTNRGLKSPGRYRMFEDANSRATEIINGEHPELRVQKAPLNPKQVQATAWFADRGYVDRQLGGSRQGGHLHAKGGKPLSRSDLGAPLGQQLNPQQFGGSR